MAKRGYDVVHLSKFFQDQVARTKALFKEICSFPQEEKDLLNLSQFDSQYQEGDYDYKDEGYLIRRGDYGRDHKEAYHLRDGHMSLLERLQVPWRKNLAPEKRTIVEAFLTSLETLHIQCNLTLLTSLPEDLTKEFPTLIQELNLGRKVVRVLHYTEQADGTEKVIAAAHTDQTFTFHPDPASQGFQFWNKESGWFTPKVEPDQALIYGGVKLWRFTEGKILPQPHRVIYPIGHEPDCDAKNHMSIVCFADIPSVEAWPHEQRKEAMKQFLPPL